MLFLGRLGLVTRREGWFISARGWVLLGVGALIATALFLTRIHPFLAVTHPVPSRVLVVEGWLADEAILKAAEEFHRGNYELLLTSGVPIEAGSFLTQYKDYAQLARETLLKSGFPSDKLVAVPAARVLRNRTYASAVAVRDWLATNRPNAAALNLFTGSVHARRSWLVYQRVTGMQVGVFSMPDKSYDPKRWFLSSQGAKSVIEELIGCSYTAVALY